MNNIDVPIYEYICQDGNYGVFGLLRGAPVVGRAEFEAAKKGSN
jgi:hypothetical protein